MDAASLGALSTALDVSLPSALKDALQQLERAQMEREDLAARGIQGRFAANRSFNSRVDSRYWIQSFHFVNDEYFEAVRRHRADLREVQRVATTAGTDVATAVDQMLEDLGSVGEETESDDEDEDDEDAEMADACAAA